MGILCYVLSVKSSAVALVAFTQFQLGDELTGKATPIPVDSKAA